MVLCQIFKSDIALLIFDDQHYMIGTGIKQREATSIIWYLCEALLLLALAIGMREGKKGWLDYFWYLMELLAIGKIVDEFLRPCEFTIGELRWIVFSILIVYRLYRQTRKLKWKKNLRTS